MDNLTLEKVAKSFGSLRVIKGVDLQINAGEFTVFVGPSGSGKSTLLRAIAGLEEISEGMIHIGDKRIDRLEPSERGIAMVFQNYALYPHMTVAENISFGLRIARTNKKIIAEKVDQVADILQIKPLLSRKPKTLSGGQRQRVAIGRAIVREPKIFLFDEPLSNLDAKLRVQMRRELTKLHKQLKASMIYVTHDQVEAMTMADRIVILNDGMVEQVGKPLELYANPRNLFVAGFIGSPSMNFLKGKVRDLDAREIKIDLDCGINISVPLTGTIDANPGDRVTLGVRPEELIQISSGTDVVHARVESVERLGGETYIYAQTQSGENITVHTHNDEEIDIGDDMKIGIPPTACHLFAENGNSFFFSEK